MSRPNGPPADAGPVCRPAHSAWRILPSCTCSCRRVVPEAEGKKWASTRGFGFFETSAKDGDNVAQMFEAVFAAVTNKK